MYNRFLSITVAMLLLLGCSKELSVETGGSGLPGSGGGNQATDYGWTFTGRTVDNYRGCIDSAFYQPVGPGKALYIYGTDSANNTFVLSVVSPTSNVNAGTYSFAQGGSMVLQDNAGNTYIPRPPSPFSLQLTRVNDTIAEGNFSGTLTNSVTNTTINVSNGKFKALIGKENPCGISGGGPGGGGTNAAFVLNASGTTCSNAFVDGDYYKNVALDATNTVELEVNVTVPGDWQITTTAVNGMTFTGSGTFTGTGANTIELTGSGTPTTAGNNVIPLQAGSSSCNFTITVETAIVAVPGTGDYFPTTANSNWMYYLTDLSTSDEDSLLTTSTGANVTVGGQTYAVFDNDPFDAVYRKANGNYYRYGPLDYVGILDTSYKKMEYIFLKDNVAMGATWESPVADGVFVTTPVKYKKIFTIVEKNVSMVVMGVIYNNVITVSEKTMISAGGTPYQKLEETFVSYAKGIGLINAVNEDIFEVKVELKRFRVF